MNDNKGSLATLVIVAAFAVLISFGMVRVFDESPQSYFTDATVPANVIEPQSGIGGGPATPTPLPCKK